MSIENLLHKIILIAFLSLSLISVPTIAMTSLHTISSFANTGAGRADAPLTILVHGLDSSSRTWKGTMENLKSPCVAIDQRGSGFTPLGDPEEFSQQALVEDLHQTILSCLSGNMKKVVLVGHSLGGRIVLGYAASCPERVAALVIEDMDISERNPDANAFVKLKPYSGVFDRERKSKEEIIQALIDVGYPQSFIDKGLATGRIEPNPMANPPGSTWWSHVNPDFRKFCYQTVLSTSQGRKDCQTIANLDVGFPVHVMVAGEDGTVCIEESIKEMEQILGDKLTIHRYPKAGHSIHSTTATEFQETLENIILQAKV